MVEYNLNYTVVNFQIPQSHISSSFENKLKFYVNNRNVVLLWEWQVNIAKVRANNNLNPVSIFFRNLWRNAHRSVVVCCLLTARNAKLAVLPQNSTLASTPSALTPCCREPWPSCDPRPRSKRVAVFALPPPLCSESQSQWPRSSHSAPLGHWLLSPSPEEFALRFPSSSPSIRYSF